MSHVLISHPIPQKKYSPPHLQGALTMSTWPQIIRLRFRVKVPTKSTRAGRKLGGPVSTRHWGLRRGREKGMSHRDRVHGGPDASTGAQDFHHLLVSLLRTTVWSLVGLCILWTSSSHL